MREKIKTLVLADLIFLTLLTLSGIVSGFLSTIIYFSAYIIPFSFAILSSKVNIRSKGYLLPVKNIDIAASGLFPTVITVIVISTLTSRLMELFGKTHTVQLGDSLGLALLVHALLPAILEEGLFRYLPMKLLAKDNARVCIVISALFFALMHHSVFSFAYAFVAGVSFMLIDIISASVIPSLVIHFSNNALSVLLMFYSDNVYLSYITNSTVAVLACCSLIYLFVVRKRVYRVLSECLVMNEKYKFSYDVLLLILPTVAVAVGELLELG